MIKTVVIDMQGGDTIPDPVRVRSGDSIKWVNTRGWDFAVEIQQSPSGAPENPFEGPHPWESKNGKAQTGLLKKDLVGLYYKTVITVWPIKGNSDEKIVIDPHIIIEY